MEKVTFGLIGAGNISRRQHLPNLMRSPLIKLKTLCDLNETVLHEFQEEYGIPQITTNCADLFADPEIEAVVIATRDAMHTPLTLEALRAGKHVYVEKPLAHTADECREIIRLQQETGKQVCVGYNRRFSPAYQLAKKLIGAHGGVRSFYYRITDDYCLWTDLITRLGEKPYMAPGNRLIFEICHIFDLVRWFCDAEAVSVYGVESRPDEEALILKTSSGATATIVTSGYATSDTPKERLEVMTATGGITVEEFCELRTFGYPDAEPIYRFAGHTHPDNEFMHKYLLEKLGAEAMYAIRRNGWEIRQRFVEQMGIEKYTIASRKVKDLLAAMPVEFFDRDEMARYIAVDGKGPIFNYMVEKGWAQAVEALATSIRTGQKNPDIPTAEDGLKATELANAAMESRNSGKIITVAHSGV